MITLIKKVEIGLKMEAGDCPPFNMNAMQNMTVKTVLKIEECDIGLIYDCSCCY